MRFSGARRIAAALTVIWIAFPGLEARTTRQLAGHVEAGGVRKRVVVIYDNPAHAAAARRTLQESRRYVTHLLRFFGSYPHASDIRIRLQEQVLVDGRNVHGRNDVFGAGVFLQATPHNAPLLTHEINHYYYYAGPKWLMEGVVSFLPFYFVFSKRLGPQEFHIEAYESNWVLTDAGHNTTILGKWGEGSTMAEANYPASLKLQCELYQRLGPDGYASFLRLYAARQRKLRSVDDVVELLASIRPGEYRRWLQDWLENTLEREQAFAADADFDGLVAGIEAIAGTDPLRGDTDGNRRSDRQDFLHSLGLLPAPAAGIVAIDGLDDWPREVEPESQQVFRSEASYFRSLRFHRHRGFCYFLIEVTNPFEMRGKGIFFDLLVDRNGDNRHRPEDDADIAFWTDRPATGWISVRGKVEPFPAGYASGFIEVIELIAPEQALPRGARVFPIIRDEGRQRNLAEWGQWIVLP